jgi:hypothetical protein
MPWLGGPAEFGLCRQFVRLLVARAGETGRARKQYVFNMLFTTAIITMRETGRAGAGAGGRPGDVGGPAVAGADLPEVISLSTEVISLSTRGTLSLSGRGELSLSEREPPLSSLPPSPQDASSPLTSSDPLSCCGSLCRCRCLSVGRSLSHSLSPFLSLLSPILSLARSPSSLSLSLSLSLLPLPLPLPLPPPSPTPSPSPSLSPPSPRSLRAWHSTGCS